jgi:catechol 2,3-dioxygenase-like lactoylglutathione lyase family enzyme
MSDAQICSATAEASGPATVSLRLEVTVLGVSDVDRAKVFYQRLGWRLDADFPIDEHFRIVRFTPPGPPASIQFGTGVTTMTPGSAAAGGRRRARRDREGHRPGVDAAPRDRATAPISNGCARTTAERARGSMRWRPAAAERPDPAPAHRHRARQGRCRQRRVHRRSRDAHAVGGALPTNERPPPAAWPVQPRHDGGRPPAGDRRTGVASRAAGRGARGRPRVRRARDKSGPLRQRRHGTRSRSLDWRRRGADASAAARRPGEMGAVADRAAGTPGAEAPDRSASTQERPLRLAVVLELPVSSNPNERVNHWPVDGPATTSASVRATSLRRRGLRKSSCPLSPGCA